MSRKAKSASLIESLKSEKIEFLQLGASLLEIAEMIGPPKWWIANTGNEPVPLFWGYPGGLELSFEAEKPYPLARCKLSAAGRHFGKVTRLSHNVRIRNDLPIFDMTVSGLLSSGVWDLAKVEVGICQDQVNPMLDVCVGGMRLPFSMTYELEDAVLQRLELTNAPLGEALRAFDEHCRLMGIYFLSGDTKSDRFPLDGWRTISAEEYLSQIVVSVAP